MLEFKIKNHNEQEEEIGYNSRYPICLALSENYELVATLLSDDPKIGFSYYQSYGKKYIEILENWLIIVDNHINHQQPFEIEDTLTLSIKDNRVKLWMSFEPDFINEIDISAFKEIIQNWKNYVLDWLERNDNLA
ncbi:hypothetical protein AD998_20325 [bacterium 336/3]|nr:hypothetical protein AD998_20325 [bacterium 336/3]